MVQKKKNPLAGGGFSGLIRLSADKKLIQDFLDCEKKFNTNNYDADDEAIYGKLAGRINGRWQDHEFKKMYETMGAANA